MPFSFDGSWAFPPFYTKADSSAASEKETARKKEKGEEERKKKKPTILLELLCCRGKLCGVDVDPSVIVRKEEEDDDGGVKDNEESESWLRLFRSYRLTGFEVVVK